MSFFLSVIDDDIGSQRKVQFSSFGWIWLIEYWNRFMVVNHGVGRHHYSLLRLKPIKQEKLSSVCVIWNWWWFYQRNLPFIYIYFTTDWKKRFQTRKISTLRKRPYYRLRVIIFHSTITSFYKYCYSLWIISINHVF